MGIRPDAIIALVRVLPSRFLVFSFSAAATVTSDGVWGIVENGEPIVYGFNCAQVEETIAQRTAWKTDFDARFEAQLVTVEKPVRVPEPSPHLAIATALLTLFTLLRRYR